jgi:2-C-methyl-D-erythritol 4-phosphate cytidylyltransferase
MDLAIVLVAAGASTRMGFSKLWTDVSGTSLLARAIACADSVGASELVVVVALDRLEDARALAPGWRVAHGGARRRDSVAAGLGVSTATWLAIHDAARALAPPELFRRGFEAAQATGAAVPGMALKDTIKRVTAGQVVATPPRNEHVAVQTPQVFRRDVLQRALALTNDDVTDEAALVERLGVVVSVFPGDERAFKVTTPLDFALARTLLAVNRHE